MRLWLPALLFLVLVASACGQKEETAPPAPARLTGVITDIASGAGGEITGFDLDAAGMSYNILIEPDRDYGFELDHLYEHESTGDPVRVRLRSENEALYALQIDDA
jgi:hypothetical protein